MMLLSIASTVYILCLVLMVIVSPKEIRESDFSSFISVMILARSCPSVEKSSPSARRERHNSRTRRKLPTSEIKRESQGTTCISSKPHGDFLSSVNALVSGLSSAHVGSPPVYQPTRIQIYKLEFSVSLKKATTKSRWARRIFKIAPLLSHFYSVVQGSLTDLHGRLKLSAICILWSDSTGTVV
jgi:hypothetical protein